MRFNFPKKPDPITNEDEEKWNGYKAAVLSLENEYSFKSSNNPNLNLFYLFNTKESAKILNTWQVFENEDYFKLIMLQYNSFIDAAGPTGGSRSYKSDGYLYGIISTKLNYGHVLIRPEKILDKVIEIFNPVELDFPHHKKFSRQFFVLSDNQRFVLQNFNFEILEFLSSFKKLELEIVKNHCLFRLEKSINKKEAHQLCKLGIGLSKLL